MLVMYSFLSRTSRMVKLMTSSPILLMSSMQVERMRSATISGSLTICSTVELSDNAAQMAFHDEANEAFALVGRFGEELLGSGKDGFFVGADFDLGDSFNGDRDTLLGVEVLLGVRRRSS